MTLGAIIPFSITILITVFAPMIEGGTTHLPVFVLRVLVLVLLASWLALGLKDRRLVFYSTPLDPAVAMLLIVSLVSVFIAPYRSMALTWVQLILYYALYFYLARAAITPRRAGAVVLVVMLMAVFEACVALFQQYTGLARVNGTFFNPNMLADYLLPGILIAFSLLIFRHRWVRGWEWAAGLVTVALLCGGVVVLTGSRGGVLAMTVGLFVVVWTRKRYAAVIAAAVLVVSVLLFPNPVKERLHAGDPFSYSRADIWKSSLRMAVEHPVGVGLGNFKYYWPRYNFPVKEAVIKYGKAANTAHNEYLHAAAEMGIPGVIAFLLGASLLGWTAVKCVMRTGADKAVAAGIAGGIAAFLVHAAVDSNMHEPGIVFLVILEVATLLAITPGGEARRVTVELGDGPARRLKYLSPVLLLLMFLWALVPALGYYYSTQAKAAMKGGDPQTALGISEKASMIEPGDASHHYQIAAAMYAIYSRSGNADELHASLTELDEAQRLNPADKTYPALEATIEYTYAATLKDVDERRAWLDKSMASSRRAMELDPYGWSILLTKGRAELALGDKEAAAATFRTLASFEPNYLAGRLLLARVEKDLGKTKDALDECYDIIKNSERLAKQRMDPNERVFVTVDMEEVRGLARSLETVPK